MLLYTLLVLLRVHLWTPAHVPSRHTSAYTCTLELLEFRVAVKVAAYIERTLPGDTNLHLVMMLRRRLHMLKLLMMLRIVRMRNMLKMLRMLLRKLMLCHCAVVRICLLVLQHGSVAIALRVGHRMIAAP